MARQGAWRRAALAVGMVVAGWLVSGCGAGALGGAGGRAEGWPTVTMIPFSDQWASSKPRFFDIADQLFRNDLPAGTIQFRYDPSPADRTLVGEIKGSGLKPNFCYQLKLMGKPGTVSGGLWGSGADNATNYAILTNARWWKYKSEVPAYDTSPTAQAALMNDTEYLDGWVAGYNYFGYVMTDENGTIKYFGSAAGAVEAPTGSDGWVPIKADHCYHITAKTGQNSFIVATGTVKQAYTVKRTTACYQTAGADQTIELWYEREAGNSVDFALSAGLHDVVLMVTEESFHNQLGGLTNVDEGGYWQSTWVSDWTTNVSPKTGRAWTPVRGGSIRFTTPNTAPTASFTATPSGLSVSCVSTSTDADGTIASYAWTFGDGGVASGPNAAHTYAAAGTYTIALTVTDNLGLQSTTTRQVTVVAAPNNVMTATVYVTWLGSVGKYQPYAKVTVMANGAPCASAVVTGLFSGAFTSKASAVTTNASGVAEFYGPPRTKSTGALTFRVTKITKTGYTAAGLPVSGSY